MSNYAVVESGVVTNVIVWDGITGIVFPEGAQIIQIDAVQIGETRLG